VNGVNVDKPFEEKEESTKHPIKMDLRLMGERLQQLPEHLRAEVERMCKNPPKTRIDTVLTDGQELPFCGGISVIHTPGHTPGHISLYLRKSRTLIAADALESIHGKLQGPNPHNTPDMITAVQSLKRLLRFPIDRIICYHGGLCDENAEAQLRQLIGES
jgi:glyoxylase-like metal-dependent hydrolase (beta-lactamase superfamily II)